MKQSIKHFSVLIPESENAFMTVVVNCLAQKKNVKIYVISNLPFSEISHSNKFSNFAYYPKTNNEIDWLLNIEKELEKHKIDLILPVDIFGIRTLIKNKDSISFENKIGILPTLESFDKSDNKSLLAKHLIKYGIPCPETYFYSKQELLKNIIKDYPILFKPAQGVDTGEGIIKFNHFSELRSYLLDKDLNYQFIIQKFVKGYDIDCSVLCENGKILASTIQKGTLASEHLYAPPIGLEFLNNNEIEGTIKKLMKSLNWSGVAHVDLRYDENENDYKIIEINPRFWQTTEASEIAGVNFPYLYLLKSLNEEFEMPIYKHVKFLNLFGLKKSVKNDVFFIFKFKFIFNNTTIKYYKKDPLPLIYIVYTKVKNLFK